MKRFPTLAAMVVSFWLIIALIVWFSHGSFVKAGCLVACLGFGVVTVGRFSVDWNNLDMDNASVVFHSAPYAFFTLIFGMLAMAS